MKKILAFFAAVALAAASYAQLPDGSIVPDFTVYEINKTNGNMVTTQSINLYNLLNDGKTVFIDVSATWCSPCWSFHQTGTLDGIWSNYGPNSSNYDSYVIWMEGSQGNYASLSGTGTDAGGNSSQGNWLNGVEYPIVPLNMSPNSSNQYSVLGGLGVAYYPTIYMVCPNRMAFEMERNGSNQAQQWHGLISTTCPATTNTNDAMLGTERISQATYYCDYSFQPQIKMQNVGSAPLTSATLRLTHGSNVQTTNWTGNLAQFATTTVTLPTVSGTENGSQTFTVEIVSVNGQADEGNSYNTHSETYMAVVTSDAETASEDFSGSDIPDSWSLDDQTGGYCYIYQGALIFNSYSISSGGIAELSAPLLNFSNTPNPHLFFDLCYKRYNDYSNDRLQIMVSSDCGSTWTSVFNKAGADLATGANTTSNYVADTYVSQTIDLSQFALQERVIVKFVFTSDYGNNIWIDNINITNIDLPAVTTSPVTGITFTTATCGGEVTDEGNASVTARGVCWSTTPNPTIANNHTADGSGTGSFTSNLTGLTAGATYYVRAYATSSWGTSYGNELTFTTMSYLLPTVTTASVTDITPTTAECGGNITADGGASVTSRGVCWSTHPNPTTSDSHTTDGTGTGNFTSSLSGLTPNTTYYMRAYATNSVGTAYGNEENFHTPCGAVMVEISGDTVLCEGSLTTLTATGATTYQWNTGTTGNTLQMGVEGTYTVIGTDNNGCIGENSITVTVHSITTPTLLIDGEISACQSSSATLSVAENFTSYSWSTGDNTSSIEISMPGYYWVDVTDENGCVSTSEITHLGASILITGTPTLCMVGVENGHNLIVWEELESTNVQNYRIYRENNQTDAYELLATVPASRGNAYEDTTVDPTAQAWRYRVTAMDVCQGETPMSEMHKTLHLTVNQGIDNGWNLVWSPYEGIEFANYKLYRGTANNNLQEIATLPSTATSYTDYNNVEGPLFYQIEAVMNGSCISTDATYTGVRSNIVYNGEAVYTDTIVYACEHYEWFTGDLTESNVYQHNYTSELGYEVHALLHLTIATTPDIAIGGTTTLASGGTTTLYVPSNPLWTYLWNTGATTNSITVSPTETTTYTVTVTDGPCTAEASTVVTVITGVNEWETTDLHIYPNPTTGIVTIELSPETNNLQTEIQVFDVYGRLLDVVAVETLPALSLQTTTIDLSQYATGIYMLKVVNDGDVIAIGKVVKE